MSVRQLPKNAWAPVKYSQTSLGATTVQGQTVPGGLDLTTPTLRLQPGALRDVLNFECATSGGYTRVKGNERYDGRAKPSDATYTIVQFLPTQIGSPFILDQSLLDSADVLDGSVAVAVGDSVVQVGSGAVGTVIALVDLPPVVTAGGSDFDSDFDDTDFGGGPPIITPAYMVLTMVSGVFDNTNSLVVGTVTVGVATGQTFSLTAKTKAIYTALAADAYRALILKVPGSGPSWVVAMAFAGADRVYAFRANIGSTAMVLWQASPAGWVLVPYLDQVAFTAGGTAVPLDNEILIQGGVTATIRRVVWQSGAWAGSAVGKFVVTAPVGGSFAAGAATTSSGSTVTLSGPQTPITMAAGGRFEFEKCNFSGQLITRRIFGCDGVNPPFSFDGITLVPIDTGLSPNRPSHIRFHKNFLFLSQEASLIFCAAGDPFKWSAVDGAGEIATGDTVTGMITLPGSQTTATLGVYLRTNTAFLYGTSPADFNFVTFNNGIGAVPYSIQNLFDTFFLDALGVVTLKTTLNYGNFLPSTLTANILPFIQRQRGHLMASSVNREKGQYRLYFSDGYALYCTIHNQQYLGASLVLFPDVFTCSDTTNTINDHEETFVGSQSGYVYEMDIGTSFDGAEISAFIKLAWDPIKSPRILKRFRAASVEVQGDSYAEFNYGYQLGYSNTELAQLPGTQQPVNLGSVPHWDEFTWDEFTWDGTGLSPTDIDETGTAENVSVVIASGTNYIGAYTIDSVIHHYSLRRGMRV